MNESGSAFAACRRWGLLLVVLLGVTPHTDARESVANLRKTLRAALANQKTSAAMEAIDGLATHGTASAMDAIIDSSILADNYEVEQFVLRRLVKMENQDPPVQMVVQVLLDRQDHRVLLDQ